MAPPSPQRAASTAPAAGQPQDELRMSADELGGARLGCLQDELREALQEHRRALHEAAARQEAALRAGVVAALGLIREEAAGLARDAPPRGGGAAPRAPAPAGPGGHGPPGPHPPGPDATLGGEAELVWEAGAEKAPGVQEPDSQPQPLEESPAISAGVDEPEHDPLSPGSPIARQRSGNARPAYFKKTVSRYLMANSTTKSELFPFRGAKDLKASLKWVRRNYFDYVLAVVIVLNAVYLGAQTLMVLDTILEDGDIPESDRWMWLAADIVWAVIFFVELLLRILAYQVKFFTGSQRWWNWFDCFVMLATLVALMFDLLHASSSFGVDLLKVLRLARMVRSLRTSKSKVFHTLKTLSYTVAGSANAFLSAILLLFVVIFMFGVMFMQGLQSYLLQLDGDADTRDRDDLVRFFGSARDTILTLVMSISGGMDWKEVSTSLWSVGWLYTWVFVVYIVFTVLCVLNILNGVFVNAAIESAKTNKELAIDKEYHTKTTLIEQVVQWFIEADKDQSKTVTQEEMKNLLADDKVLSILNANNIDVSSASKIFKLLDKSGTGEVGPEDFVDSLISLQGPAKAIDLASLQMQCDKMAQILVDLESALGTRRMSKGRSNLSPRPSKQLEVAI